jgi:aminoglycoside phosphotransferase (APT) family kinase protein
MIPPAIHHQLAAAGWRAHAAVPTATRGLKSGTFVLDRGDEHAVLKVYNDRGGTPSAKCGREWLALCALAGPPLIPRPLLRGADGWLLMECLPGRTLRSGWDALDAPARARLCQELGLAYARIAAAPQDAMVHEQVRRSRPAAWPDSFDAALAEIERLLRDEPRVSSPTFAAAAERVRALAAAGALPQLMIKADCNVDNALVEDGALTGIIDWEQACIGDRWTWLGIVLDHAHFLDWPALRAGLEEVGGRWSREDEELVLAAGFLCVWRKIIEFDARSAWFGDPGRQEARMRAMAAAMGRPEALPG